MSTFAYIRVSFWNNRCRETYPGTKHAYDIGRVESMRLQRHFDIYDKGQFRSVGQYKFKDHSINLISQRTKEAQAAKKLEGVRLGRPVGSSKKREMMKCRYRCWNRGVRSLWLQKCLEFIEIH